MKSVRDICAILLENNLIQDSHIKLIESDYQKDSMHDLYASILKVVPSLSMGSIMTALSKFYSIPVLDISMFNLSSMPENILTTSEMVENKWIPLSKHNGRLKLAVADPSDFSAVKQLSFKLNIAIDLVLVNGRHMENVFNQNSSQYFKTIDLGDESLDGITTVDDAQDTSEMVNSGDDDQPIVKFVHKIIFDAVKSGASDIHFEPYEKTYRVRYRIDGVLSEVVTPPQGFKDKIAARIKVVSKLDIAEKRIPQDGRLRLSVSQNQVIDFRVSTLPTAFGEKIVLRILDKSSASLGIEALGFDPTQEKIILDTIYRPYGMALVTGPTGSGKTVTLYSCLNLLNEADRNISTAEDPIEIPIAGINQVAINEKTGMQFGVALRAFLRQDPDVIMVGEIRDKDTAEMAIKAAQTGHLVLSTLHTNDAPSALTRLVSMGIPTYNVGDAILTIIAQRLVRRLCKKCKRKASYSKAALEGIGFSSELIESGFQPFDAVGCEICHYTGYKGRVGVFEVMPISEAIRELILRDATSVEIAAQARKEGVLSLRQSGLNQVINGVTTISEITANTNE